MENGCYKIREIWIFPPFSHRILQSKGRENSNFLNGTAENFKLIFHKCQKNAGKFKLKFHIHQKSAGKFKFLESCSEYHYFINYLCFRVENKFPLKCCLIFWWSLITIELMDKNWFLPHCVSTYKELLDLWG